MTRQARRARQSTHGSAGEPGRLVDWQAVEFTSIRQSAKAGAERAEQGRALYNKTKKQHDRLTAEYYACGWTYAVDLVAFFPLFSFERLCSR